MARPKKLSEWWLRTLPPGKRVFVPDTWERSGWDRKLAELEIRDDAHALQVLKAKSDKCLKLRMWIGEHAHRRFIPVKVLDAVGLKYSVECRFPID